MTSPVPVTSASPAQEAREHGAGRGQAPRTPRGTANTAGMSGGFAS